MHIKYR